MRLQHAKSALDEANQAAQMKMAWGALLTLGIVGGAYIALAVEEATLVAALPALIDSGPKLAVGTKKAILTSAEALAKLKSDASGLKDAIDGFKGVYDIAKLDLDLLNAQADPSILALARQVQECVIAQLAAKLHVEQWHVRLGIAVK